MELMIANQTVFGTAVTPTKSMPILNGAEIPSAIQEIYRSLIGNDKSLQNKGKQGRKKLSFPVHCELDPITHMMAMYSFSGKYNYAVDTPVAGANTHTFKLADAAAEYEQIHQIGQTWTEYDPITDNLYTADSVAVDGFELTAQPDSSLSMTYNCVARAVVETGSPETFVNPNLTLGFDYYNSLLKVGVLASEVTLPMTNLNISAKRGLIELYKGQEKICRRFVQESGKLAITGSFNISRLDSERAALKAAVDAGTKFSIKVLCTTAAYVTGTTPYQFALNLKEVLLSNRKLARSVGEDIETYDFDCGYESETDTFEVTMVNAETDLLA